MRLFVVVIVGGEPVLFVECLAKVDLLMEVLLHLESDI